MPIWGDMSDKELYANAQHLIGYFNALRILTFIVHIKAWQLMLVHMSASIDIYIHPWYKVMQEWKGVDVEWAGGLYEYEWSVFMH